MYICKCIRSVIALSSLFSNKCVLCLCILLLLDVYSIFYLSQLVNIYYTITVLLIIRIKCICKLLELLRGPTCLTAKKGDFLKQ